MKRFLIFAHDYYEPYGGWNDFQESASTLAVAIVLAKKSRKPYCTRVYEQWHIVDTKTWKMWNQDELEDLDAD